MTTPFATVLDAVLNATMLLPWPIPECMWDRIEEVLDGEWTPIYALLTKPRLVVLPNTVRRRGDVIHAVLAPQRAASVQDDMRVVAFPAQMVNSFIMKAGRDRVGPATIVQMTDHAALTFTLVKLAEMMFSQDWLGSLLNFQVEYIGQTRRPWRRATHRLRRHHVMRKLERFMPLLRPEDELWVAIFAFAPPQAITMAGVGIPVDYKPSTVSFNDPLRTLERRQWRNMIEAALIHQFKPKWNNTFLRRFPHRAHRSYRWFHDNHIQMALISMNESTPIRFGTAARPPRRSHCFSVHFREPLAGIPSWSELRPGDDTDDAWRWQLWLHGRSMKLPEGPPPESLHHLLRL